MTVYSELSNKPRRRIGGTKV